MYYDIVCRPVLNLLKVDACKITLGSLHSQGSNLEEEADRTGANSATIRASVGTLRIVLLRAKY